MLTDELAARDNRANLLRAFKASGCARCGKRYPDLDWSQLHVDHIDPKTAGKWNGRMTRMSTSEALAELLKCQVLCEECHRKKHGFGEVTNPGQMSLFNGNGSWFYA